MSIELSHLPKDKFLEAIGPEEYSRKYYNSVYDKMEQNETIVWNWAAALFTFAWLFYRKLYMEAIIGQVLFVIIFFFIGLIFPYLIYENNFMLRIIFGIPMLIFFGLFGNYIYVSSLCSNIKSELALPDGSTLLGGFLFTIGTYIVLALSSTLILELAKALY